MRWVARAMLTRCKKAVLTYRMSHISSSFAGHCGDSGTCNFVFDKNNSSVWQNGHNIGNTTCWSHSAVKMLWYDQRHRGLKKVRARKLQLSDRQLQISHSKISIKKYRGLSI